ncbi:MAG: hypothetical protein HFH89_03135 [Lachnospiraceae bacterium]|nr:hypothetical protein [uncultured Acetatifactor sp.]MCI8286653.1 hypothetical protein [Lachnospiraceae bacterium]
MRRGRGLTVLLTVAALALGLTGCGENQIPDLTDEEIQAVGEYVAITLMKYDINHQSRLMELTAPEVIPEVPVQGQEEKPSGMGPVDDTPVVDSSGTAAPGNTSFSLEEVIGLPEGVTAAFLEHTVCDSYPNESDSMSMGFSLDASEGRKLLVLHFSLTNATEQEQEVDLFSSDTIYSITVNEDYIRRALTTLLPDDMGTYKENLSAGGSASAVLVIEIEEQMADNITSVSLKVKNEDKVAAIQLMP